GPVYGATLAAGLGSWRQVFWLNLPLSAAILGGLWLVMRRGRPQGDGVEGRRDIDWASALLLGLGLGLAVVALYPDDVGSRPVNTYAVPLGIVSAVLLAAFGWRQARRISPLLTHGLVRSRAFGGSLGANLLTGGALIVALVDVPILARGVYLLDTLDSGLVLMRFLVGIPVGALAGGWLAGWLGQRATAPAGLLVAGRAVVLMSSWGLRGLSDATLRASVELAVCGIGFGLVIAPLSLAVLDRASSRERGLASSLVVLSRSLGMVVALAALTAFGLARLQSILTARHC